ncbi:biotin-dependent carboxyltransferase family protein [Hymenobacter setariae]|uniref:Biotin-dependent carboxyltransferase family protein n=1 Tax=Hymenobacter setariae TaxID=2594794 RepID=A0A558BRA6_9BACT|nr:biotin-dependent carboxyltransferase family protein [Hymenobacter setariae]TVT39038.1 biotin-dependent carboxyltransferase family protein [Hymenobacter setariae]
MSLSVVRPGLLTTVQDLGRLGYQHLGVVLSGALDAVALRVANLLVGNPQNAAGLEITLLGPIIRFETDSLIALTGADLSPTLDGQPAPLHRPVAVWAGTVLAFGAARAGCRAYLAVAGGLAVPQVLGSRATYLRAGLGGWHGRALRAGDELPVGTFSPVAQQLWQLLAPASWSAPWVAARWLASPALCPTPHAQPVIRAVRGPEYEQFTEASQRAFWHEPFVITPAADRMGYRLQGPALTRDTAPELLSSAVTFGTMQVPPGGQPIVLLADAQTTGGYPRLAQVITADFGALAQAAPGQALRFQEVSLAEAQALYLAQERRLQELRQAIEWKLDSLSASV